MKYLLILIGVFLGFMACSSADNENKTPPPDAETSFVPDGYKLVWADEFNTDGLPSSEWWFETGNSGWGNNEPQYYVDKILANDTVAKQKNGILTITAFKLPQPVQATNGTADIISARMNTSKSWKYGYFEARIKQPKGKGTWSAFWMMPKNYTAWPDDGEIDIMEYVGYRPNVTQASVHCKAYNGADGNNKTATMALPGAEEQFFVYGLLWTENEITAYVNGRKYFSYPNDHAGNKQTWPFDAEFYLKLNLAIGGNWGGLEGIDPNIFPAKYQIDYVRVYQK